jgi:hypothetical protein
MWQSRCDQITESQGLRYFLTLNGHAATYSEVLVGWQSEACFRDLFNSLLAEAPFETFRWETPPVTSATVGRPFEFVLIDSPGLAHRPDPGAFAEHFGGDATEVVVFANLGGDATLVVPCPAGSSQAYGHIAAFARLASRGQRDALWQSVGAAMSRRLSIKPVWLSTAGAGVPWLHVRLDDRPKYYCFSPYRQTN